jgi:hypothetical protein
MGFDTQGNLPGRCIICRFGNGFEVGIVKLLVRHAPQEQVGTARRGAIIDEPLQSGNAILD